MGDPNLENYAHNFVAPVQRHLPASTPWVVHLPATEGLGLRV